MPKCNGCGKSHNNKTYCSKACRLANNGNHFRGVNERRRNGAAPSGRKGKTNSTAHNTKIVSGLLGYYSENDNWNKGGNISEGTKRKISKVTKGKPQPSSRRKRAQWEKDKIGRGLQKAYKEGRKQPSKNSGYGKRSYVYSKTQRKKVCMRSMWEVNVSMWLDLQGIDWEYEPKVFDLDTTTYRPDFYLPKLGEWIEVKGRWLGKAKSKYNEFRRMYPEEHINLFDASVYKTIAA
tara:strand:+ start:1189 stop:1893 length:705 start_codon:yes stop_codon:yes gene_type:complete